MTPLITYSGNSNETLVGNGTQESLSLSKNGSFELSLSNLIYPQEIDASKLTELGFDNESVKKAKQQIDLFLLLSSHRGKNITSLFGKYGKTSCVIFLKKIQDNVTKIKEALLTGAYGNMAQYLIDTPKWISDRQAVYERILLEGKVGNKLQISIEEDIWEKVGFPVLNEERKKRGLGNNPLSKWTQIVPEFLGNPEKYTELFIETFGFIPQELYTKVGFYQHRSFEKISLIHQKLRDLQSKSDISQDTLWNLKNARSLLLTFAVKGKKLTKKEKQPDGTFVDVEQGTIPGTFESLIGGEGNGIVLDTNGIKLTFFLGGKNINSHIPYHELDIDFIQNCFEAKIFSYSQYLEVSRRFLESSAIQLQLKEVNDIQYSLLYEQIIQYPSDFSLPDSITGISFIEILQLAFKNNPEFFAKIVTEKKLIVPGSFFETLLESVKSIDEKKFIFYAIFTFAQEVNGIVTRGDFFGDLSNIYDAIVNQKGSYKKSLSELNNPLQYNAFVAIQKLLVSGVPENSFGDFCFLRGKYATKRGFQNFVELIYKNYTPRRFLTSDKHTFGELEQQLEKIPELTPEQFEALHTFTFLMQSFKERIFKYQEELKKVTNIIELRKFILENTQFYSFFIAFIGNYFQKQTHSAVTSFTSFKAYAFSSATLSIESGEFQQHLKYFSDILGNVDAKLSDVLSGKRNINDFLENVEDKTLTFDEKFLEENQRKLGDKKIGDTHLFRAGDAAIKTKIAVIDNKNAPTGQAHAEAQAIKLIGLDTRKKLIVVSGGCKHVSSGGTNGLEFMAKAILGPAGRKGCNISIPATQSGIGTVFSQAYLEYLDQTGGDKNAVHMFSIIPGKNVFYGQDDVDIDIKEAYAAAIVDAVALKNCSADWGNVGIEIIDAGYFDFIQWAESIYNRVDTNNDRIHVTGNGGLFSIVESYAAMNNGAQIVLAKDSGRFATIMSAVIDHGMGDILKAGTPQEKLQVVEQIARKYCPDDIEEWITKDWGGFDVSESQPQDFTTNFKTYFKDFSEKNKNDSAKLKWSNQLLYRKYFLDFIEAIAFAPKKPITSAIGDLESTLEKII